MSQRFFLFDLLIFFFTYFLPLIYSMKVKNVQDDGEGEGDEPTKWLYICIGNSIWRLMLEIVQITSEKKDYFTDFWNFIDFSNFAFFAFYCVMKF